MAFSVSGVANPAKVSGVTSPAKVAGVTASAPPSTVGWTPVDNWVCIGTGRTGGSLVTYDNTAWQTCTLTTAEVPSGSKAALLWISNHSGTTNYPAGIKPYGNTTEERHPDLVADMHTFAVVRLDSSLRFKTWLADANLYLYLAAYSDEDLLTDTSVDMSLTTTGSYQDRDITAYVGTGATAAWVELDIPTNYNKYRCLRKGGSTQDLYSTSQQYLAPMQVGLAGLTTNVYQEKIESTDCDSYLWGYDKRFTELSTWVDHTIADAHTWDDVVCSEVPSGTKMVVLKMYNTDSSNNRMIIRKKGGTFDPYNDLGGRGVFLAAYNGSIYGFVALDSSKTFQALVSTPAAAHFTVVGYL